MPDKYKFLNEIGHIDAFIKESKLYFKEQTKK